MKDREESYYRYLLTSEVSEDMAKAHREMVADYFWKIFQARGCRDVLDVGCGLGFFISKAAPGIRAVGVDSNSRVVKHCLANGLNAIAGNALELPLDPERFDGIMCAHLLEHIAEPEPAFREFCRVLKNGGVLIVRVPPFDRSFYNDWTHVRPFTRKGLTRLAVATGFRPVKVFSYHYDFPFRSWRNAGPAFINRIRQIPVIRQFVSWLIRIYGFAPSELVFIAVKEARRNE